MSGFLQVMPEPPTDDPNAGTTSAATDGPTIDDGDPMAGYDDDGFTQIGAACIEILTVGDATSWVGERIVEIGIATSSGQLLTTVVNPRMDLYTAQADHGLTTRDVQLAPTLSEAWPVIEQVITGHALIGIDPAFLMHALARDLREIDADTLPALILPFDPSRLGRSTQRRLHRGRALHTAAGMLAHLTEGVIADKASIRLAEYVPTGRRRAGYLMGRTSTPHRASLGGTVPDDSVLGGTITVGGALDARTPQQALGELLARAWDRVVDPDQELVDRVRAIEDECRVGILPRYYELPPQPDPATVLAKDPVVTVSGWLTPDGNWSLNSDVIKAVLERLGLWTSDSVLSHNVGVHVPHRERQDVLLVAERGSQSRKVKNAAQHGVPILTVDEFLTCLATHPLPEPIAARALTAPPAGPDDIPRWLEEQADFVIESEWE